MTLDNKSHMEVKPNYKDDPKDPQWREQAGRERFEQPSEELRSGAEITTALCADGGDNTLWGQQNAASEAHTTPQSLHRQPERRR